MDETIAEKYAKFAEVIQFDDIPSDVIERAKELLLDFLGVTLAGYKENFISRMAIEYVREMGGKEECTVLGEKERFPGASSSFVNAILGHAIDLDDGHKYAEMHPSVVIIPPLLAAAEFEGSNGKEILTAMVIGYEIALRVGRAVNPKHLNRGYHSSSTCGPFGGASATSKLFALNESELCNAISLAGLQSSGLQEMLHEGQASKPFQVGKAAQSGFLSALFAKKGLCGPSTIFEGNLGWLKAVTDTPDMDILTMDLGDWWDLLNVYTKPYPTCRHVHPGIDIALSVDIDPHEISSIDYHTYGVALMETGNIFFPKNESAAKFSLPYGIAVALCKKEAGLDAFSDKYLNDAQIRLLLGKISLHEDKRYSEKYPGAKPARMIISLNSGEVTEKQLILPKGEPEFPLSKEELEKKFFDCTSGIIKKDKAQYIIEKVYGFEQSTSIKEIIALCVKEYGD